MAKSLKDAQKQMDDLHAKMNPPAPAAEAPAPVDDLTVGELVREEDERGLVARAVDSVRNILAPKPDAPELALDTRANVMVIDRSTFRFPHEAMQFSKMNANLARITKRDASAKLQQAENAYRIAKNRMSSLRQLAAQDGVLVEFDLIDSPPPAGPDKPVLVRVTSLLPWFTQHQATASDAYKAWYRANHDKDWGGAIRDYQLLGVGHVADIPEVYIADLVARGVAEVCDPSTPKRLPDWHVSALRRSHAN